MSVTSLDKDFDNLTLSLVADFDAPVEAVWQLWADPRQLERWWGPPSHPATFERHDLSPGADVAYFMTGPDGKRYHGWWQVTAVEPPRSLEFTDGFADDDGVPLAEMPATNTRMQLSEHDGGVRMELRSTFASLEQMKQMDAMEMSVGLKEAVGQMDALLV